MNITEFETKLREAIKKAQESGWYIHDNLMLDSDAEECCPIGAAIVVGPQYEDYYAASGQDDFTWDKMAKMAGLDVTGAEASAFAVGFDGGTITNCSEPEFFNLGKQFRDEFITNK